MTAGEGNPTYPPEFFSFLKDVTLKNRAISGLADTALAGALVALSAGCAATGSRRGADHGRWVRLAVQPGWATTMGSGR